MSTPWHYALEELEDYFLDLLPRSQAVELEAHLISCESCAASARKLYKSWSTIEPEMSPRLFREAFEEEVVRRLLLTEDILPVDIRTALAEWFENLREGTGRLLWSMHTAILGPQPVKVLGSAPEEVRTRGAMRAKSVNVTIASWPGGPLPDVRIEGDNLALDFRIARNSAPPSVFLLPTGAPAAASLVPLIWSARDGVWSGRIRAAAEQSILVIGPPDPR